MTGPTSVTEAAIELQSWMRWRLCGLFGGVVA